MSGPDDPHVRRLAGRRVLVTRPRDQAAALVDRLEALGAEVIAIPLIRIAPPAEAAPLREAATRARTFDWIVFASANAVDALVNAGAGPALAPASPEGTPRLCAVGPATAARLAHHGLRVDLVPRIFDAQAVAEALVAAGAGDGARVLLPRAEEGRETVADRLREAGARVTEVVAYRTLDARPEDRDPDIADLLAEGRLDAVTFASPSAVHAFARRYGGWLAAERLAGTLVAVIGPVTAEAAAAHGIRVDVQPDAYTADALADALAGALAQRLGPPAGGYAPDEAH